MWDSLNTNPAPLVVHVTTSDDMKMDLLGASGVITTNEETGDPILIINLPSVLKNTQIHPEIFLSISLENVGSG